MLTDLYPVGDTAHIMILYDPCSIKAVSVNVRIEKLAGGSNHFWTSGLLASS
jgi:hypothetical protein